MKDTVKPFFKDYSLGFLSGISLSMLIVIYRTFA